MTQFLFDRLVHECIKMETDPPIQVVKDRMPVVDSQIETMDGWRITEEQPIYGGVRLPV